MNVGIAILIAVAGVLVGIVLARRSRTRASEPLEAPPAAAAAAPEATPSPAPVSTADSPDPLILERARLIRVHAAENAALREERDAARAEVARYRELVIDIESNAPPPLLGGRGQPDDLKLIVGIGPVLERMLHQLGVTTYRQIARWNERDIEAFDARLPEFPGRIRRDGWVTQARALHQSVHGEPP